WGGGGDGFGNERWGGEEADIVRGGGSLARLYRVGDDQFFQSRLADALDGAARQHTVSDVGINLLGAFIEQGVGGIHQRAAGIDDIVDQDAGAAIGLADDVGHFGFAGSFAPLVDDGERCIDALGETARAHHAADVGRHDDDFAEI